ncbi:hypothetical protein EJB05_43777, partial [Eragrostis curvula]
MPPKWPVEKSMSEEKNQHFIGTSTINKPSNTTNLRPPDTKVRSSLKFHSRKESRSKAAMVKGLVQLAKKWQRMAALARKRLTSTPAKEIEGSSGPSTSVAGKSHFVVYLADRRRFEVPLEYLGTKVFCELLRQSQEEFGFSSNDGRITLPCDATVMEYMMCLLRRGSSEEVERVLLSSMVRPCSYGKQWLCSNHGKQPAHCCFWLLKILHLASSRYGSIEFFLFLLLA